jgi:hypothetical protein
MHNLPNFLFQDTRSAFSAESSFEAARSQVSPPKRNPIREAKKRLQVF